MKLMSFLVGLITATILAGSAEASPSWTWYTEGTIANGWDGLGLFGAPDGELAGFHFTKSFTVSVDPNNYSSQYSNSLVTSVYGAVKVPFTMTLTVGGVTLSETETVVTQGQEIIAAGALWPGSYYPDQIFSAPYGINSEGHNLDSMDYAQTYDPKATFVPKAKFDQTITVSNVDMFSYFYTDDGITSTYFNSKPDFITVTGGEVPEPTSTALLGLGLLGVCVVRWRKCKA
jgi:hypothetical protein